MQHCFLMFSHQCKLYMLLEYENKDVIDFYCKYQSVIITIRWCILKTSDISCYISDASKHKFTVLTDKIFHIATEAVSWFYKISKYMLYNQKPKYANKWYPYFYAVCYATYNILSVSLLHITFYSRDVERINFVI